MSYFISRVVVKHLGHHSFKQFIHEKPVQFAIKIGRFVALRITGTISIHVVDIQYDKARVTFFSLGPIRILLDLLN